MINSSRIALSVVAVAILTFLSVGPAYGATYWISPFYTSDKTIALGGCIVSGDKTQLWIHAYEAGGDTSGDIGTRGVFEGNSLPIFWDPSSVTQHYSNYALTLDKYKLYHY